MARTFATWPQPVEGHTTFRAPCPCGVDAVWEQTGNRPDRVQIDCWRCRARRRAASA